MKYQLGNYVKERGKPGQILTVSEIDLKNLCVIDGYVLNEETAKQARILPVEKVSPIPLDAEWLERSFKFEYIEQRDKWQRMDFPFQIQSNDGGGFRLLYRNEPIQSMKPFYFAHQLQNIFFDHTHTELTTKKEI